MYLIQESSACWPFPGKFIFQFVLFNLWEMVFDCKLTDAVFGCVLCGNFRVNKTFEA